MPDDSAVGILHEAVESARAALQVYKREKHPLEWASAHGNIGAILNELAHRHEGEAGLKYVQAAGAALQNAMHVYTREELPVQWAGIQRNLCAVFLREAELKDRHGGPSATSMAISACRAALEVYTRTEDPLSWAATQFNLGAALLYRAGWAVAPQECLADLKEACFGVRVRTKCLCPQGSSHTLGGCTQVLGTRLRIDGSFRYQTCKRPLSESASRDQPSARSPAHRTEA